MGAYRNYFLVFFIISSILSFLKKKKKALVLELIGSRMCFRFKNICNLTVIYF